MDPPTPICAPTSSCSIGHVTVLLFLPTNTVIIALYGLCWASLGREWIICILGFRLPQSGSQDMDYLFFSWQRWKTLYATWISSVTYWNNGIQGLPTSPVSLHCICRHFNGDREGMCTDMHKHTFIILYACMHHHD